MGDYVAITGIRPSVIQFSSDSCTLFQKLMNIWGVQNTEKYGSILVPVTVPVYFCQPLIGVCIHICTQGTSTRYYTTVPGTSLRVPVCHSISYYSMEACHHIHMIQVVDSRHCESVRKKFHSTYHYVGSSIPLCTCN